MPRNPYYTVRVDLVDNFNQPAPLDGPTVVTARDRYYRAEPWRLADGQDVVIVRALVDAPSLSTSWRELGETLRERWGDDVLIIEDWGRGGNHGVRYCVPLGGGLSEALDEDALRERGLVLTDDLLQETGISTDPSVER